MKKLITEKNSHWIVGTFFAAFFVLGSCIFSDYGISWDEFIQRISGYISYRYITGTDDLLLTFTLTKYYGPIFEILLISLEQLFKLDTLRSIYLMRHFVTFLIFYTSVYFFYRLAKETFNSWKVGLFAALLLILSPRIFAHAFYNSKDLPFMSMFIISFYTMVQFLNKKSKPSAFFHALTCGLLTDIRIMGVLVPVMTIGFYIIDLFLSKYSKKELINHIIVFVIYALLVSGFTILFWPILWKTPIHHFIASFKEMSKYPANGAILYFGNFVKVQNLPWHYVLGCISITTPLLYVFLFCVGAPSIVVKFFKKPKDYLLNQKAVLGAFAWFFVPVLAIIILKSVLYDMWRQMFFVYPGFLFVAITGFVVVWNFLKEKKAILRVFTVTVCCSLLFVAFRMIKMHPYQNVYFSIVAGKNIGELFERDYWGLSYREGLEYILANDSSLKIPIYVENSPGEKNANLLPMEDKKRLIYVKHPNDAKYFLSNFKGRRGEYASEQNEFHTVEVDGFKILGIYRFE